MSFGAPSWLLPRSPDKKKARLAASPFLAEATQIGRVRRRNLVRRTPFASKRQAPGPRFAKEGPE